MRLFMDTMVALMLAAILVGVVWHNRTVRDDVEQRTTAQLEVRRFQQQVALQAALAQVEHNERGYPRTIDPEWFQGMLPNNPMLSVEHPWLEVADPEQKDLIHPQERVASTKQLAKFWYNPHTGVVRARVPVGMSDGASLELYNFVNDSDLPTLFADGSRQR